MSIYETRLIDSETNEPVTAEELNITEEQYLGYVVESLGLPGAGHVRVRTSRAGATRRVYAEAEGLWANAVRDVRDVLAPVLEAYLATGHDRADVIAIVQSVAEEVCRES